MSAKGNVLVTGGAGYVGSHTCKALAGAGYTPVVFDSLENGHDWAVKWGPLVEADLRDFDAIARAMAEFEPVAVLHFAGYIAAGESMVEPAKYYANNILGLTNTIEAAQRQGVKRFIFSSTAAVYGDPVTTPITEDHPKQPINPYGSSKLMSELILADAEAAYGIAHVNLRYFNASGADPDLDTGEAHDPETHLIPLAIRAAFDDDYALKVFGCDYDTEDGTAVRDYVHVSDLASAHVLALDYIEGGGTSDSFNLGIGQGYSVRQVIEAVESAAGCPVKADDAPRRAGDPPSLVASGEKARTQLGWKPDFSDLDTIARTAVEWYRQMKI